MVPMSPIRIGFVGLSTQGWAAFMLAPSLLQSPLSDQYALAAVSTSNPHSAQASAKKYSDLAKGPVKAYHSSTAHIAGDGDVDMIAIAVKATDHKAAALPVIQAGKDFFLEWPAGRGLRETREIADAARSARIRTMVGLQGRQSLVIREIKRIIVSGKIGRVLSSTVTARPAREPYYWGPYIGERNQYTATVENGATMLDIAVGHFLDSFMFTLGPFSSVSAILENQFPTAQLVDGSGSPTGVSIEQTGCSQAAISGVLKSGAVVSIHWRGGLESKHGKDGTPFIWTIDGESGSIRVESSEPGGSFLHIRDPVLYVDGQEVKLERNDGMSNTGRAWAEYANGNHGLYPTIDDAVEVKTLLEAIVGSARDACVVHL